MESPYASHPAGSHPAAGTPGAAERDETMNRPALLPSRSLIFILVRSLQEPNWLG
jgi:hypothetical protein